MRSFWAPAHVLLFAGVLAAPVGCGGKSHGSGPDVTGAGGAAGEGGAPAVECPAGIPGAAELAKTPREDTNLELLALKLSSAIVADQAIYDRVVRDVGAIRMLAPELADVAYFAPNDGRSLALSVDSLTYEAMQAGSFDAWSCLNEAYGAGAPSFNDFGSFTVSFMESDTEASAIRAANWQPETR